MKLSSNTIFAIILFLPGIAIPTLGIWLYHSVNMNGVFIFIGQLIYIMIIQYLGYSGKIEILIDKLNKILNRRK